MFCWIGIRKSPNPPTRPIFNTGWGSVPDIFEHEDEMNISINKTQPDTTGNLFIFNILVIYKLIPPFRFVCKYFTILMIPWTGHAEASGHRLLNIQKRGLIWAKRIKQFQNQAEPRTKRNSAEAGRWHIGKKALAEQSKPGIGWIKTLHPETFEPDGFKINLGRNFPIVQCWNFIDLNTWKTWHFPVLLSRTIIKIVIPNPPK